MHAEAESKRTVLGKRGVPAWYAVSFGEGYRYPLPSNKRWGTNLSGGSRRFCAFYQSTDNGREIATLRFESSCGSLATGECGQARWTFKRTGFLSPKISVREAGSETNIALFTPGWMGSGWVVFSSGRHYHLRHTNFGAPNGRSKLRTGHLRWPSPAIEVSSSRAARTL